MLAPSSPSKEPPPVDSRPGPCCSAEGRRDTLIGIGSYALVYRMPNGRVRKTYAIQEPPALAEGTSLPSRGNTPESKRSVLTPDGAGAGGPRPALGERTTADDDDDYEEDETYDALLLELAFFREQALLRHCRHPLFCHVDGPSLHFVGAWDALGERGLWDTAADTERWYGDNGDGEGRLCRCNMSEASDIDEGVLYRSVVSNEFLLVDRVAMFDDLVRRGALRLVELHSAGVFHRDIKPDCFLVAVRPRSARDRGRVARSDDGSEPPRRTLSRESARCAGRFEVVDVQLCDLNMAALALGQPERGQLAYSESYRAPDMGVRDDGSVPAGRVLPASAEVWAFGKALLDLVRDGVPAHRDPLPRTPMRVASAATLLSYRRCVLLAGMLHRDPAQRPTLADLCSWSDGADADARAKTASGESVGAPRGPPVEPVPGTPARRPACQLRSRSILVEWLIETEAQLGTPDGALFFAVAMLDAYDSLAGFNKTGYQMRGVVCLAHLAAACLFGVWMPPSDTRCAYLAFGDGPAHTRAQRWQLVRVLGGRLAFDNMLWRFCRENGAWPSPAQMGDLRRALATSDWAL